MSAKAAMKFKNTELIVFKEVYFPSEDSFLLAESVEVKNGQSVLDMGTGCGIQGINAALNGAKRVLCSDLSNKALLNAEENAKGLGFGKMFEFRQGNLFSCIKKNELFDVIIFNPPYVPSDKTKHVELDGGRRGREILDLFLDEFAGHLEKGGNCFFLQSSLNGLGETRKKLKSKNLESSIVGKKKLFFEELLVFRAWKRP